MESYYCKACASPLQDAPHSTNSKKHQETSPIQQIVAAALSPSHVGDGLRVDLTEYTTIRSIEQRRQYNTKFELSYDEYLKLSAQIKSDFQHSREMCERFNQLQQGSPEYYKLIYQIEWEEERFNTGKQRLEYLREKLSHIGQLITDYDNKKSSGIVNVVKSVMSKVPFLKKKNISTFRTMNKRRKYF